MVIILVAIGGYFKLNYHKLLMDIAAILSYYIYNKITYNTLKYNLK